jgi:2-polyprenyl-6-methoxyphenol hydroxylase-like FAD-dependent oxidoreductase
MRPIRCFRELGAAQPPAGTRVVLRRAVVLGGSIAGLLAARVLSDHAAEVVVVERDDLDATGVRPGVPQAAQVHVLLDGGRVQLDRWFPGFSQQMIGAGAVLSRDGAVDMYLDGVRKVPASGEILSSSRALLETHIRSRTLALPNVRLVRAQARGLMFAPNRVTGARYTAEGDRENRTIDLPADLVVDAMGRSSRLGAWLEEAGWTRPPLRRIGIDIGYATASFSRAGDPTDITTVHAAVQPGGGRRPGVHVLTAVENNRWFLLVSGFAADRPTRNLEEFRARCRELPPMFARVAHECPLVGPVETYRQADSRRLDFHAVPLPGGIIAVGDAVASFNPVYGQGMSLAALHASCLSAYLRSGPSIVEPARGYFTLARLVVDAAWQTSATNDLALPHVDGPYPRGHRVAYRISDLILRASAADMEINRRFLQVTHMRAHPNTLIRPGVLLRAVRTTRARSA